MTIGKVENRRRVPEVGAACVELGGEALVLRGTDTELVARTEARQRPRLIVLGGNLVQLDSALSGRIQANNMRSEKMLC